MIIIYGWRTVKRLRIDSNELVGPNAKCLMPGCGARCSVYNVTPYFHMYFIPLCRSGDIRPVVQCSHCRAMFDLNMYQKATRNTPDAQAHILNMLRQGKNEVVEKNVRSLLKTDPNNINLMCYLNVALNGLGRAPEADQVASNIVYQWHTNCRSNWIAKGCPKELSAFPRIIMNMAADGYRLEGKQFFEPERIDDDSFSLYKILAFPAESTSPTKTSQKLHVELNKRLFKLIQTGKFFVLAEILPSGTSSPVISYPDQQKPDIRKVMADVASFLTMPVAKAEVIPEGADAGVVSEIDSLTGKASPSLSYCV